MDTIAVEGRFTSGVYPKREVAIVRGLGARVWDEQGREYIDCVGGHGVAIVGHCNPAVVEAICQQAHTLITCPEIFYNDTRARLLEKLVSIAPDGLGRAYLCNSGTEAVEAAIKLARLSTGRPGIVAAMRGFHGRTMGALSATWEPDYREAYQPLVPGFSHVPYNKLEAMAEAVTDNTAAVLLEVVQGEGGVNLGDPQYLRGVRDICDAKGALLIIDEVQTGFGRTGALFACQHHQSAAGSAVRGQGHSRGRTHGRSPIQRSRGQYQAGRARVHLRGQSPGVRGSAGGDRLYPRSGPAGPGST